MYSTILLCYDGSPDGREALHEGVEIARRFGAHAHLLSIAPIFTSSDELVASKESLDVNRADFEAVLHEGIVGMRETGVEATGYLAQGRPVDIIVDFASRLAADLIVLGHRHQSALARWWHGSVGAALINIAPCSILVALDRSRPAK